MDEADLLSSIVKLVADEDGISMAKAAKKLGLSQSQLLRRLSVLGAGAAGGDGWIEVRDDGRPCLYLSDSARGKLAQSG